MDILLVALAAFGGGVVSAALGWLESGEPFEARKFASSALRAFLAGAGFAAAYTFAGPVAMLDILTAFLAGAGVDVLGNRLAGSIGGHSG
ncbi:MAG: hypothetical protein ACOC58_00050 [Chloroflexota bacterium]